MAKVIIDLCVKEDLSKKNICDKICDMIWNTCFFMHRISAYIILLNDRGEILNNRYYIGNEIGKIQKIDYAYCIYNLCFCHEIIGNDSFFQIFDLNTYELICEQLPEEIDNYEKFYERMILFFQDSCINDLWEKYKNFRISVEAHLLLSKLV